MLIFGAALLSGTSDNKFFHDLYSKVNVLYTTTTACVLGAGTARQGAVK